MGSLQHQTTLTLTELAGSIWKPLRGPLRSWPLALCDLQSLSRDDLVPLDEVHAGGVLESQQIVYNPTQKWCYLSNQKACEVLIFKGMDSEVHGEGQLQSYR